MRKCRSYHGEALMGLSSLYLKTCQAEGCWGWSGQNMTMLPFVFFWAMPCSWKRQHLPCKPPSAFWTSFLKYMHITIQMQKCVISILFPQYSPQSPDVLSERWWWWWWWLLWQESLGELLLQSRAHNNKPHPSLTACVEYIVHHRLNLYFPQVGF